MTTPWEQLGRDLALERHSHVHPEYRPSARQRVAEAAMVEVVHNARYRVAEEGPGSALTVPGSPPGRWEAHESSYCNEPR